MTFWGKKSIDPMEIWLKSLGKIQHGSQEKKKEDIVIERVKLDSVVFGEEAELWK